MAFALIRVVEKCQAETVDAATVDSEPAVITSAGLGTLMALLVDDGHQLIGPTARDGAIVIEPISGVADLPLGWGDEQTPGRYRLRSRGDEALFGFASPAGGWKRYLFPAHSVLWRARSDGQSASIEAGESAPPRRAFVGIRGCDLAAIGIQDRVFLSRGNPDPVYAAARKHLFIVAVDCHEPAATCFCPSMGHGPAVEAGADLVMTELDPGQADRHRFLLRAATPAGATVMARLTAAGTATPAAGIDLDAARASREDCAARISRQVRTDGLAQLLQAAAGDSVWDDFATECLSCGNCTMACPTCFCSDIDDLPDVTTGAQERVRTWASCFERDHSYIHGGAIRKSIKSRYRQWLTHKFSTWWDQFDTSGCVGCGRCLTWCPAAIDITANLAAVRAAAVPEATSADSSNGPS